MKRFARVELKDIFRFGKRKIHGTQDIPFLSKQLLATDRHKKGSKFWQHDNEKVPSYGDHVHLAPISYRDSFVMVGRSIPIYVSMFRNECKARRNFIPVWISRISDGSLLHNTVLAKEKDLERFCS